jgi:hypothetical protein
MVKKILIFILMIQLIQFTNKTGLLPSKKSFRPKSVRKKCREFLALKFKAGKNLSNKRRSVSKILNYINLFLVPSDKFICDAIERMKSEKEKKKYFQKQKINKNSNKNETSSKNKKKEKKDSFYSSWLEPTIKLFFKSILTIIVKLLLEEIIESKSSIVKFGSKLISNVLFNMMTYAITEYIIGKIVNTIKNKIKKEVRKIFIKITVELFSKDVTRPICKNIVNRIPIKKTRKFISKKVGKFVKKKIKKKFINKNKIKKKSSLFHKENLNLNKQILIHEINPVPLVEKESKLKTTFEIKKTFSKKNTETENSNLTLYEVQSTPEKPDFNNSSREILKTIPLQNKTNHFSTFDNNQRGKLKKGLNQLRDLFQKKRIYQIGEIQHSFYLLKNYKYQKPVIATNAHNNDIRSFFILFILINSFIDQNSDPYKQKLTRISNLSQ